MYIHVHIYIYTYIHTYTYTYINIYIYIYTYVCIYTYIGLVGAAGRDARPRRVGRGPAGGDAGRGIREAAGASGSDPETSKTLQP